MSSHNAADGPGGQTDFACDWLPTGMNAAAVRVAGDLDSVTAPRLRPILDEACEHARLVAINLREVTFLDSTGLRLLLDASRQARERESRLVLVGAPALVERLLAVSATRALIDAIPATVSGGETAPPVANDGIDPLRNPVNARIVTARVMDIEDRALWAHGPDGTIRRAWAPASDDSLVPAGARVEIYLDQHGAINGWWHTGSRVAINQRHLATVDNEPETATGALACQGSCELLWQAPAAAQVLDHREGCLTCAGHLVLV